MQPELMRSKINPIHSQGGIKSDRYKWKEISQSLPRFEMIDKTSLSIDNVNYQRTLNEGKARSIASKFNWASFGALVVVRRADSSEWIVEGQHRHAAAMYRTEIKKIPCLVFDVENIEEEANIFIQCNVHRSAPKVNERIKALVTADDDVAVKLQNLVDAAGYSVTESGRGRTIRCVGSMYALLKAEEKAFMRAWPVILDVCNGNTIHEKILTGLVYLEINAENSVVENRKKIRTIGYKGLIDAAAKASSYYSKGGPKIWAAGFADAINSGKRLNRIQLS